MAKELDEDKKETLVGGRQKCGFSWFKVGECACFTCECQAGVSQQQKAESEARPVSLGSIGPILVLAVE